ncbi:ribonuclease domain-containing protein [Allobranchiibius huperziae]|uniref:Ribonuclease T1 n=1 Tax=Allobranchiibius huperziae TaxID=1874116 RepID=A0A853DKH7_9MICO|nr:ribonuclease domain-containing protein [Allobranchiibius huperziae]NYJ75494.1 ribonuclease T1 [Allobranchiibius huperziae]
MLSLGTIRRRFVPLVLGLLVVALIIGWIAHQSSGSKPHSAPSTTLLSVTQPASSSSTSKDTSGLGTVAYADLPSGARHTLSLVDKGGPYPYRQDGTVYQNRNRDLPIQPRGYYHEYTVVTPGSGDRGPRRIVVGRDGTAYYTADHYDTFRRVQR